jgi:GrpB-like predicted nucleotidyltransferase (UPF0157 family)
MEQVVFIAEALIREQAAAAFERYQARLLALLPQAEIQHIGSTAIPGALTKGDLDIVVRVSQTEFDAAEAALATHYERNTGSTRTASFASFKDDSADPPLGIQLVVRGSALDDFCAFRDFLATHPAYLTEYNQLKQAAHGQAMDTYREQKSRFVERILRLAKESAGQAE